MTKTSHRTQEYKINRSRFGGEIYPSDYYTSYPRYSSTPSVVSRITSDQQFDEWCRLNKEAREKERQFKQRNRNKQNK